MIIALGTSMHEYAYLVGKCLLWVKGKLGHGNFLDWLEQNVWFRERTARYFMAFAVRCDSESALLEYHPGKSAIIADFKALPTGKYQVIYADPPWQYDNSGLKGSAESHYPTMSTEQLCQLDVGDLAGNVAVLFLWVTSPFLQEGLQLCQTWGFEYKTTFIWIKDRATYGKLGFYNYGQHEFLFAATKGSCLPQPGALEPSVLFAPKRGHSEKPEAVYELIEKMYPGPYIELFARKTRPNWATWGTL